MHNRILTNFVDKSKTAERPALKGINYTAEYIYATDGNTIIRMPNKTEFTGLYDLQGRILEEKYPNVPDYVRNESPIKATFSNVSEVLRAVTMLKPFNVMETVLFSFDTDGCKITAENMDFSAEAKVWLDAETTEPFKMAFNASHLIKMLRAYEIWFGTKTLITFNMSEPSKALQIETPELFLATMPVMWANYDE